MVGLAELLREMEVHTYDEHELADERHEASDQDHAHRAEALHDEHDEHNDTFNGGLS